jgi:hypothetical protein
LPFAAGLSGCVLLGCAAEYGQQGSNAPATPPIPLPNQALLTPPPDPGCALKTSHLNGHQGRAERAPTKVANLATGERPLASDAPPPTSGTASPPSGAIVQTDPNASLAERIKLEYERDCFQRAETRVRERLVRLQSAVRKTAKAVKRSVSNAPQ